MDNDDAAPQSAVAAASRSTDPKEKETVKVVVRCRPFSTKENNEGRKSIITIDTQAGVVGIRCPDNDQIKPFAFDAVYDETTSQRQFYDESGYPLVESIFEGYNGTIFAYGQTGCGKTHTMQGRDSPAELRGVIPLSFDHIFENIQADPSKEYMVRASYLEIYNEEIRDLLADDHKKKLELKEAADGTVYVKELIDVVVSDVDSINRVMTKGFKNRTVGATLMNEGSSRSHSIFTVVVEMGEKVGTQDHFKAGKLNLVDLAGSERQSKTGATGSRLKEGCKINLSLSALGNVISALVDGKGKHIPYRDSKLTRLLQDSLGGNTKTLMVAAISPADYNYDETLSTLRYANRAKNIKNKPIVNEDPKDAKLREYKEEIERLKKMLDVQSRGSASGGSGPLSGMSTPTRPLSSSPIGTPDGGGDGGRAAAAREREDIAKYQREAAEMMAQAKRMMDEAQALREQQQAQPPASEQQQTPGQDPSQEDTPRVESGAAAVSADSLQIQQSEPPLPLDVVRVLSSSSMNSPKPGSAGRPASLPPIGSVQSPRADPAQAPANVITAVEAVASVAQPTPVPPSPRPNVVVPQEDPAITKALQEAARVDAQAKAMMAKVQQLMKEAERRATEPPKVQIVQQVVVKEVIPDDHLKEKAQLHELNASILTQKDRIGQELVRTQQAMESFVREKDELQSKLHKIEGQILGGASARHLGVNGDSEITLLKQQVEYRRAQIKLREKAKKEAHYEATQKALTLEKQQIKEELKTAHETAQATLAAAKKKETKYRAKLETARQEVVDLNNEFERERETLLDTIREQTKETKLLEQLVELFLPQNELVKVWERAVWTEDKDEWQLPKIKPRSDFQKLKLPSLGGTGGGGGGGGSPIAVGSGGAEVASDDDGASTIGPSSVRSVGSSSATKRPKPTAALARPPPSSSSAGNGGFYSARIDEIGGPPLSANQTSPPTHRLLSPATTRLPSALRTPQQPSQKHDHHESHEEATEPPPRASKDRDKDKPRRKSKTKSSEPPSPTLAAIQSPAFLAGKFFPPAAAVVNDHDQLTPLSYPPDAYQPRDRLQSRQGSRQGPRSHSNTSSHSSLGEFDAPSAATGSDLSVNRFPVEKPPIASRGSASRSGSGTRKHRSRPSPPIDTGGQSDVPVAEAELLTQEEHSPDASLLKKSKRDKHTSSKKKRNDKNREPTHGSDPSDEPSEPSELQSHDLNDGFFLPRTTRSGENQDR